MEVTLVVARSMEALAGSAGLAPNLLISVLLHITLNNCR